MLPCGLRSLAVQNGAILRDGFLINVRACINLGLLLAFVWCAKGCQAFYAPIQFKNLQETVMEALKQGADALFIL
jgi:hypothetical protein